MIVDFGVVHRTRGQLLRDGTPNSDIPGAAANAANIDAFFGGSQRWRSVDPSLPVVDRERAYMHVYFEDVLGGWFAFTSACPVRGSYEATPEYWMVHAASHVDAHMLMNDEIAKVDKELYLRTYGEGALPEVVEQLYQEKVAMRLDALEHDILQYVRAADSGGVSFEAIVLGTLERHFGQVKVGKWAGDYARAIRKLIEQGLVRRQKERLAAAFDRWERITVASASEQQSPRE